MVVLPFCPLIKGECKEKDCVMWEEFEGNNGELVKFCKLVECIDSLKILLTNKVDLLEDDFEDFENEKLSENDDEIKNKEPSEEEKKLLKNYLQNLRKIYVMKFLNMPLKSLNILMLLAYIT